jgi:hypothetical protein
MTKVFLSYRREDSAALAGRIYDRLASHFGRASVFMDIDTIPFGVDFQQRINEAVSQCDTLLALIGDRWLGISQNGTRRVDDPEDFVRMEIEAALNRRIPVIPLLIGRASMPSKSELPSALADLAYRNALQVDPGRDFHNHIDRLIHGLDLLLGKTVASPPSSRALACEWSAHDRAMLEFFYPCFDRAAFRIPFLVEVPREMIQAIEDTISALGTGIRKTRGGIIIDRGRPKAEFESEALRACFDGISGHLHDIMIVYELASSTNQLDVRTGAIIARDKAIPAIIDGKRNLVLKALNEVYSSLGRAAFPLIPEDHEDKFILFDRLRRQFWDEYEQSNISYVNTLHNKRPWWKFW